MPSLIKICFFIALFLIFLLPPTDPDLGWQLRCGELFWQEQSFCEDNQFSVLLENYSWPNHAWGYQATIYPIFKFASLQGLTIFNALLMTAAFGFLYSATKNSRFEKMLAILATIYFGWGVFSFGIRSQLLGFFFFNLTLYLLTKMKERPKLAFLLPLVTLVWANTHGSVILGLIPIFLSNLTTVVVRLDKFHTLKTLTPLALASAAVTLINSCSLLNSLKTKISPLRNQLVALLAVGVLLYGLIVQLPQAGAQDLCRGDVPCKAVEFLKTQEAGNIFNRYEWGGFLIWQLPEYKIFVDGRMPAWPGPENKSPYTIYLHTLQTRPGWQETLEKYGIDWILISPNTFMDLKLREDPSEFGWSEIFRDKISVIYKRL